VAVVVVARNLEPLLDAVPSVFPPEQAARRLANKVDMVNLVFQFITLISKNLIIFQLAVRETTSSRQPGCRTRQRVDALNRWRG
jgi:hypothetical protein